MFDYTKMKKAQLKALLKEKYDIDVSIRATKETMLLLLEENIQNEKEEFENGKPSKAGVSLTFFIILMWSSLGVAGHFLLHFIGVV